MPGALTNITLTSVLPTAGSVGPQEQDYATIIDSVTDGIVATPSGTQTTSLVLTAKQNRIITVATAGDGVRLPPAIPGLTVNVRNAASANACNVFPASAAQGGVTGGDQINALGVNTAFSLTVAANTTTFRCFTLGTWFTA